MGRALGDGYLDKAALFSADGSSRWAYTTSWANEIDKIDLAQITKALTPAGKDAAFANGIHIGGERYVTTDISIDDPKEVYIKMRKGKEGAFVLKTDQTLIIAHHPENNVLSPTVPATSQEAFNSCYKFKEYIKSTGY
ncbi:Profilin/allergen [Aulographum hederae CBS 113979]|uniref:Profilin n=1 Tax=Aulographum hederae CBS 113979 TaxID=1176131 RepID=A0A6G1H277_9PEZI|nr:Profilin/allergen [Aulographum hederae CBS 113979]